MDLLSGGQRQAVSLVMATLAGSEVLLLDEHTAALDPGMAEFIMGLTAEDRVGAQADDADGHAFDAPGTRLSATAPSCCTGAKIVLDVSGDSRKDTAGRGSHRDVPQACAARRWTMTRC